MLETVTGRTLKGRSIQVITKAANYVLQPGGTDGYEGNWHVEGMSHERIIASVIYYYHTDAGLEGEGLSFRRRITEAESEEADNINEQRALKLQTIVEMGTVPTPQGRLLVFPNHLQHKVAPITNKSDKVGLRKILCFFVCDPDKRVISTKHTYDTHTRPSRAHTGAHAHARHPLYRSAPHRVPPLLSPSLTPQNGIELG
jgi:hypothetical protein